MKKIKLIFYTFYVLIILVLLYFSIDILMNSQDDHPKGTSPSYIEFYKSVTTDTRVFLFISILMIIEFILQQFSIYQAQANAHKLEKEILQLKAKLYDKNSEEDEEKEIDSVTEEEYEN